MNLPQDVIQPGKQAVQALWDDRVAVMRSQTQGNVKQDVLIYEGILCHLSQTTQPLLSQTSTAAVISSTFSLRVDTDIQINVGDKLIITHKGRTYTGVAGQAFTRSFANVVPVSVERVV